jgi:hypothetical protein
MRPVLALLCVAMSGRLSAATFLMFASTSDPQVFPVLEQIMGPGDFISVKAANQAPKLGRRLGREHQFVLPGSLEGVRKDAGCGAGSAGVVMYDIEHWNETPLAEQRQPGKSIAAGAEIVNGSGCQKFAVAPDGQFMGLKESTCGYDFEAGLYRDVDWTGVDLLSIQAQRMLSDTCADKLTVDDYAGFVSRVAAYVKSKNPGITVVSQISLRYTPPEKLIAAMNRLNRVADGFYLVYPSHTANPCRYCTPANVDTVLRSVRR